MNTPVPTPDPFDRFGDTLARATWRAPETGNACVLATVDATGAPSARVVLLKAFDRHGFVFFTNLLSRKAQALRHDPRAALTFFWPDLGEQVRIEGTVEPVDDAESVAYFGTRPRLSQLGAWASEQSQPLASRALLTERLSALDREFEGQPVPCPPHWGGLRLVPTRLEFWLAHAHRLHDRDAYVRKGDEWEHMLLYP